MSYVALYLRLQLMIRQMRQFRKIFFVGLGHVVRHVLQLARIGTRNHSRGIIIIIKLWWHSVVDETATLRIDGVGVRIVGIVDIADTIVFDIGGIHHQLFIALAGLLAMLRR